MWGLALWIFLSLLTLQIISDLCFKKRQTYWPRISQDLAKFILDICKQKIKLLYSIPQHYITFIFRKTKPLVSSWPHREFTDLFLFQRVASCVLCLIITALFIIARTWKQPRCPSADEWIRKLWYIYTMECYSAIKKNIFESVLMKWMKLEPTIQSEVSQKDKHQYSILKHMYGI